MEPIERRGAEISQMIAEKSNDFDRHQARLFPELSTDLNIHANTPIKLNIAHSFNATLSQQTDRNNR
jgi:hypothetical protein